MSQSQKIFKQKNKQTWSPFVHMSKVSSQNLALM